MTSEGEKISIVMPRVIKFTGVFREKFIADYNVQGGAISSVLMQNASRLARNQVPQLFNTAKSAIALQTSNQPQVQRPAPVRLSSASNTSNNEPTKKMRIEMPSNPLDVAQLQDFVSAQASSVATHEDDTSDDLEDYSKYMEERRKAQKLAIATRRKNYEELNNIVFSKINEIVGGEDNEIVIGRDDYSVPVSMLRGMAELSVIYAKDAELSTAYVPIFTAPFTVTLPKDVAEGLIADAKEFFQHKGSLYRCYSNSIAHEEIELMDADVARQTIRGVRDSLYEYAESTVYDETLHVSNDDTDDASGYENPDKMPFCMFRSEEEKREYLEAYREKGLTVPLGLEEILNTGDNGDKGQSANSNNDQGCIAF